MFGARGMVGKMCRNSKLIKEGRIYRLPPKEFEPSGAAALNGSNEVREPVTAAHG
jgi:hypothetical protein